MNIDPCMGSGHILVYAFDVLMQIYESQGYTQRDAAVAIVKNNLYGLDIDDRAHQLAYFAVIMKGRKYDRRFLTRGVFPKLYSIKESNNINRDHFKYFGNSLESSQRDTVVQQMEYLLDTFHDAKDYGSILNVNVCDWELLKRFVDDYSFEGQVSIQSFGAEQLRSKLQEFIPIAEAMAQKYGVVVTNPPYMALSAASAKLYKKMKTEYPAGRNDLYAVFIEKCRNFSHHNGYFAMITQHTWMFLSRSEELRKEILQTDIINFVHLGTRAFEEIAGEVVQTATFVFRNSCISRYLATYVRLVDYSSPDEKEYEFKNLKNIHYCAKNTFDLVPGTMFIYWQTKQFFNNFNNKLIGDVINTRVGLDTGNNELYIRLWHEVAYEKIKFDAENSDDITGNYKWVPHTKGGPYRKWYGNFDCVLAFDNINYNNLLFSGNHLPSRQFYFLPGITWSRISTSNFAVRFSPKGMVFNSACPTAFAERKVLKYVLGLLNSKIVAVYVTALSPTMNFQAGDINKVPCNVSNQIENTVINLVNNNISISKEDWNSFEISWNFQTHPLVKFRMAGEYDGGDNKPAGKISSTFKAWELFSKGQFGKLKANEEELNRIFVEIYGLQDELTPEVEDKHVTVHYICDSKETASESLKNSNYLLTKQGVMKSFISYAVGCMFGRYSLDAEGLTFAGGEWNDSKYTTFIPDKDNCIPITDEEYFKDDIVGLFVAFVKKVYGEETLEENLDFIAKALGNKGNTSREIIRNYFLKDFFKDHCSTYSVTGSGKRPIYWLYDSGKQNGFKALIYMHRYNADTAGLVRVDYLHKMQRIYTSEIERMQEIIDNSSQAREIAQAEKRKEKLVKQLKEAKEYDEKIAHTALSRIEIDLDDGVKVNYEKVQTAQDGKKLNILAKI